MIQLSALDYLAIGLYFLATLAIAAWAARGKTTSEDLFLAGRTLGPVAVGFSLFAANVSTDTMIGLPGAAYRTGISAARSEEHTSELQSLMRISYAVFCLKKKTNRTAKVVLQD